jgi:hypothetical protein
MIFSIYDDIGTVMSLGEINVYISLGEMTFFLSLGNLSISVIRHSHYMVIFAASREQDQIKIRYFS